MKKFLKLCLAVAALATMFGFASCSNGSSDDSTANAAAAATTKKVETKTITINGVKYEYTVTDGKVDASDSVKVADDGSVTVTASDGSKVTLSKDGKSVTFVTKDNKTYTGDPTAETVELVIMPGPEEFAFRNPACLGLIVHIRDLADIVYDIVSPVDTFEKAFPVFQNGAVVALNSPLHI